MENKYKKITSNTILFAIGMIGSKAIGFFLVPLYTNVLSTSEYGTSDLLLTLSSLILPLFSVSMGESILFYGLKTKDENQRDILFKNGFVVLLVGCLFLLLLSPFFLFYRSLQGYVWFLPLYSILEIIRNYLKYYTKSKEKNLFFTLDNIGYAFIFAILNIVFLLVLKIGINGYLYSYIITEAISCIFLLIYNRGIRKLFLIRIDGELMKKMIVYSAPLIFNSISWAISHTFDKVMLDAILSSSAVGIYSAASKIPTIFNSVVNLFCQAWTISAYLELETGDKKFYSNVFSVFSSSMILGSSIILVLTRPFMFVYVGESFRSSSNYVSFLLISSIFQCYAAFFGSIIQSGKKNVFMLISTLTAALLNVVLNLFFITYFGIQGACIATAFSYMVVFLLRLLFSKKIIKFDIGVTCLVVSLLILTIQGIAVSLNYHFVIISFCSLFLLILINIKTIIKILYHLKSRILSKSLIKR